MYIALRHGGGTGGEVMGKQGGIDTYFPSRVAPRQQKTRTAITNKVMRTVISKKLKIEFNVKILKKMSFN